ncbi:hypothetical protein NBO_429g0002 [Nosema bombycis CQ1]|uniref:Uncharacterized protein n=1 Tax=Nosema bombycis (strain CQ1 / CVCC 102059) TaxID=578461 RepID=R0KP60_NOSB1|nr:hypothetical protein NBO_429g0002 [Nosema bombycis CQ1]|eukprot:EOB12481.1 hypothetical protein NBO_429g0002 [Nosema bombycis CQ1]
MKFDYIYSILDSKNHSGPWVEKTCSYHNYKIFKKGADGSIEFEGNRTDIYLYHIKQVLYDIFDNKYISLRKINSIKKKKINTEFPDFELLHFESLLECHKSLKRFVRFLNCFKLVGKYPYFDKKGWSSEDDIDLRKTNAIKINESNTFDDNTSHNLPGSSLADIMPQIGNFCLSESVFFQNFFSSCRDSSSDSSSSEESSVSDNNVLIIDKQPWRKKILFDIEEESSIDIESSSSEEDYTIESPNRRLKLIFLEKFWKEKFDKDFKSKKVGDENNAFAIQANQNLV